MALVTEIDWRHEKVKSNGRYNETLDEHSIVIEHEASGLVGRGTDHNPEMALAKARADLAKSLIPWYNDYNLKQAEDAALMPAYEVAIVHEYESQVQNTIDVRLRNGWKLVAAHPDIKNDVKSRSQRISLYFQMHNSDANIQTHLERVQGHLMDVLVADDGQAYSEAERYLERHAPEVFKQLQVLRKNK